jgi:hypothetical protein
MMSCIALVAASTTARAQTYAVFVVADSENASVDESRGRMDSAADLRRALQDDKHRQLFRMVDSPEEADVLVEVVWRGAVETSATVTMTRPVPGGGNAPLGSQQRVLQNNLRVKVVAAGVDDEIWAVDPGRANRFGGVPHLGWRELANRSADRIAAWTRRHRTLIERRRG